jgi:hypothetical protein
MEQEKPQDYHISPNQLAILFDGCQTITDVNKFIESHEQFITSLKPGKAQTAYKNRLEKVKELTKKQDETGIY